MLPVSLGVGGESSGMDLAVAYVGTVKSLILYAHVGILEKRAKLLREGRLHFRGQYTGTKESMEQRVLD